MKCHFQKIRTILVLCFSSICVLFSLAGSRAESGGNAVHIIQLNDDTINPITAEYITKSIDRAEEQKAECLIIKLDTPGGLLTSTRTIVKRILSSQVPIVVYVSPDGSRAGSAGVFITYASHIAAMAPSTNIGAAHPVNLGEGRKNKDQDFWDGFKELVKKPAEDPAGKESPKSADDSEKAAPEESESMEEEFQEDDDPMSSKILQDTVAFIKTLAVQRDRNIEWAIKSVTKSSSITEKEAKELGVIEIIARDDNDLLDQLNGFSVKIQEEKIKLDTRDANVVRIAMDARQKFFNTLANPNIAYILMILGFYGLLYEITHPGIGVPGILGTIFLILAFFSMQTLPTNYAAVALIILGLLLFIAEAAAPGIGLLLLGGLVSMILGSFLLFDTGVAMMRVSTAIILGFTLPTAAISVFLIRLAFKAHMRQKLGGQEGIVGEIGEAKTSISPGKEGKVYVHGELWNAVSEELIKKGSKVSVQSISGMVLKVILERKGD